MNGFRLGRILGFDISLDVSWFVILALVVWSFATGVFPQESPGLTGQAYLAMSLVAALLFFTSLIGHELSHSLVARAKGIQVEGITLFLFGGVARIRSEATKPGDEFLIAGVGPLASVVIGAVFLAIARFGGSIGLIEPWRIVAEYLAFLNFALAIFNLLPGFPLDGGRLLRAVAWKLTGSLSRATRVATTGGRVLGYGLIGLGIVEAVQGYFLQGLWLAFIGWYLRGAAVASYRQHQVRDILDDVTAAQTMTPAPETVSPELTLRQLLDDVFMRRRFVAFPVREGPLVVGLITLQQLRDAPRDRWDSIRVRDVMVPLTAACVVTPDEGMLTVMDRLRTSPVRRVLVMRDGVLEGIISGRDVAEWLEKARRMEGIRD
ncbi:MAG: site-2 protease family protein [Gemmatimonadota bacterium]|jgi:Zn-dependent protease/CBS domain-containing protein